MKVHQCRENEAHAYSAATSALHSAHIFPPLLCRCVPAGSKSKGEMCVMSLLCFQCCPQEISHWPFCIHTCVVAVIGSLKLCSKIILISHTNGTHFPVFFYPISPSLFWHFSKKTVIQELRTRKNGLIKRFSRVGPIITHSRESSNSQRDPQDHAHS